MTNSLDAIMAGRETAPAPEEANITPEPVAETPAPDTGQPRDDKGKFATKGKDENPEPSQEQNAQEQQQAPPAAQPPAKPNAAPDGFIPIQARDAEKAKRRQAEQRAAQLERELQSLRGNQPAQAQQPAKPADALERLLADPEAFIREALTPVQQNLSSYQEVVSETMAVQTHGQENVEAAKGAALDLQDQGGPAFQVLVNRLSQSRHPFDELVKWHNEQQTLSKYSDPNSVEAEIERRVAEALAAQTQQPPAAQKPNPQSMPSSFAAARSGGPRAAPGAGGARPLSEIMGK